HLVAGARIVKPAAVGLEIHWRELPDLAAVIDACRKTTGLLVGTHFQPILQQVNAGFHHELLERRHQFQKALAFFLGCKAHDALHPSAVVPTTIPDDDFAGGRHMRQIALYIHLRFLALGRCGERDNPAHAQRYALGDGLDCAALTGPVSSLENDTYLGSSRLGPFLELNQLSMELGEFALIFFG